MSKGMRVGAKKLLTVGSCHLNGPLLTHMRDVAYNQYPKIARHVQAEDDRSQARVEDSIMAKAQAKRERKAKRNQGNGNA